MMIIIKRKDYEDFVYVHTKTGNKYRLISRCKMKYEGKWVSVIVYVNIETYDVYIREVEDFNNHFKKWSEWKKIK